MNHWRAGTPMVACCLVVFGLLGNPSSAHAHSAGFAMLQIEEHAANRFHTSWKTSETTHRSDIEIHMPDGCSETAPPARFIATPEISYRSYRCPDNTITRSPITFTGKRAFDIITSVRWSDGTTTRKISRDLAPIQLQAPTYAQQQHGKRADVYQVIPDYIILGAQHIWQGIDHLLFVLGLMLLSGGFRRTILTITAFTIGHSLTLGLSVLDVIRLPPAPTEALIAASIVLVARECVTLRESRHSLTQKHPWVLAILFGLLHGLGFAGALRAIGLPQQSLSIALVSFNIGVELGQIAFISLVGAITHYCRHLSTPSQRTLRLATAYAMGILATTWTLERITNLWS